jgi:hypothetical protein
MKRLEMDLTELCLLKSIVVFNPGEWDFSFKEWALLKFKN